MKKYTAADFRKVFATALLTALFTMTAFSADESIDPPGAGGDTLVNETPAEAAPKTKIFGTLDLRAEYYPNSGAEDTSNYAQLGYQFNPDLKISWFQGFDSNIYKTILYNSPAQGLNPIFDQSFLRTRVDNIWKTSDGFFLSYESRIYAPTLPMDYEMNNITELYNAVKFGKKINDKFTVTFVEVVNPMLYSTSGTTQWGANPAYQNRTYLVFDYTISKKLSFEFPILWYQTKYRDYAFGAPNNDTWGSLLYIWPELDYALTDNFTLGLAFVSNNLTTPGFAAFKGNIWGGLQTGLTQFVLTSTF